MKKTFTVLILLLTGFLNFGQTEKSLIGKWHVEEVIIPKDSIPQDQPELLKDLTSAFKLCSFYFGEDGKFVFDFQYEDMKISDGKWTYNAVNKTIEVTEAGNPNSSLMAITVDKRTEDEIYFIIQETPIVLKVKK